MAITIIYNKK